MTEQAQLTAIPGRSLNAPPKPIAAIAAGIDQRSRLAGIGYRAAMRFTLSNASLLAAGTTYYLFLAVFALTALAFGIAAMLGAEQIVTLVNDALNSMFPGLLGDSGIDPGNLESLGQGTSVIGLLVLLYSGGGAISAAKISLHQVYGSHKDPRNFVVSRLILTGWLLVVAPLILVSYAPMFVVTIFTEPIMDALGLGSVGSWAVSIVALILSVLLDFLIVYLLLSTLGGIRPSRRSRAVGAVVGALAIEILKFLAAEIIAWSVGNPRYGAFAAPIAALLMLYLQCVILYAAAALTAAVAETAAAPAPVVVPEDLPGG